MLYVIDNVLLYCLIGGGLLLLGLIIALICLTHKRNKVKKQELDNYYLTIVKALGELKNIQDVSATGSRLSVVLKNNSLLDEDLLKSIHITGVVKSSKKITLVVGSLASTYETKIKELLVK